MEGRWLDRTPFEMQDSSPGAWAEDKKARQVLEMGEWKTALSLRVRHSLLCNESFGILSVTRTAHCCIRKGDAASKSDLATARGNCRALAPQT